MTHRRRSALLRDRRRQPAILAALNPWYGVQFFVDARHARRSSRSAPSCSRSPAREALYADMGHFGKRPIRLAWFALVLPGAAAQLLRPGRAASARSARRREPVLPARAARAALSRCSCSRRSAAVIASQALISGAFSLTQQAMQLGYSPRVTIVHTSKHEAGQIYIPEVNTALMVGCLARRARLQVVERARRGVRHRGDGHDGDHDDAVLRRRARSRWNWSLAQAVRSLAVSSSSIDLAFFCANAIKIESRRLGAARDRDRRVFTLMTTWKHGRASAARSF